MKLHVALLFAAGILATDVLRVEPDALCCGWKSSPLASVPADDVSVTFYLKETNSALVQEIALSVSDPSSSRCVQACDRAHVPSLSKHTQTYHHTTLYHTCSLSHIYHCHHYPNQVWRTPQCRRHLRPHPTRPSRPRRRQLLADRKRHFVYRRARPTYPRSHANGRRHGHRNGHLDGPCGGHLDGRRGDGRSASIFDLLLLL